MQSLILVLDEGLKTKVLRPSERELAEWWRDSGSHNTLELGRSWVQGSALLPEWMSGYGPWCVSAAAEQPSSIKQAVQAAGREALRNPAQEAKCDRGIFLFMHVSLDEKEAANISAPTRMTLLRCSDGFVTLDLISMLVIFTWLDFQFFTVKNLRLLRLRWHFRTDPRRIFVTRHWKRSSRPAKNVDVARFCAERLHLVYLMRSQSCPDTLHVAAAMEDGRPFRVHEPTKGCTVLRKGCWSSSERLENNNDGSTSLDGRCASLELERISNKKKLKSDSKRGLKVSSAKTSVLSRTAGADVQQWWRCSVAEHWTKWLRRTAWQQVSREAQQLFQSRNS